MGEVSIETLANGFDLDSATVELNSISSAGRRGLSRRCG